jgi:hypothetical protein
MFLEIHSLKRPNFFAGKMDFASLQSVFPNSISLKEVFGTEKN